MQFNSIDLAVIEALRRDPLASNRDIAQQANLSAVEVARRLQRIRQRQIAYVTAVLDLDATGQKLAYLRLRVAQGDLDAIAGALSAIDHINWLGTIDDSDFNLIAGIRFQDENQLNDILIDKVFSISPIEDAHLDIQLKPILMRGEYINFVQKSKADYDDLENSDTAREQQLTPFIADGLDRKIISKLADDGRVSNRSLAREFGVNPGTIRNRIFALRSNGIMKLQTRISPLAMGLQSFALLDITFEPNRYQEVVDGLLRNESLYTLMLCSGGSKLIGVLLAADAQKISDICANELRHIAGVRRIRSSALRKNYKIDTLWGAAK